MTVAGTLQRTDRIRKSLLSADAGIFLSGKECDRHLRFGAVIAFHLVHLFHTFEFIQIALYGKAEPALRIFQILLYIFFVVGKPVDSGGRILYRLVKVTGNQLVHHFGKPFFPFDTADLLAQCNACRGSALPVRCA